MNKNNNLFVVQDAMGNIIGKCEYNPLHINETDVLEYKNSGQCTQSEKETVATDDELFGKVFSKITFEEDTEEETIDILFWLSDSTRYKVCCDSNGDIKSIIDWVINKTTKSIAYHEDTENNIPVVRCERIDYTDDQIKTIIDRRRFAEFREKATRDILVKNSH